MADPVTTLDQVQTTTQVTPAPTQTTTAPADVSQSQAAPTTTAPAEPAGGDILTRVSQKKAPPKPEDVAGTFKMFDDVADPVQRQKLIDREKERTADYTRKMQELSHQKQEFEKFQQESKNWSPERIQKELLNNPQFVQAAQQVATMQNPAGSGLTDEQFSALTPGEKNQLLKMNQEIGELRQQNFISAMTQRDSLLQSKYGDYEALKVNQAFNDLARMNPLDLKEHIYKSIYHDQHVKDAYEEGKKDKEVLNQTRVQASTTTGVNALASDKRPIRDKRDTDQSYFIKLADARIAERKSQTAIR